MCWFLSPYHAELDPLDETPQHLFLNLPDTQHKRPLSMDSERSFSGVLSEGCPSVTSDEHIPRILIWVLLDVSDELHDGTSHEV